MAIQFFDSNPYIVNELKAMDHNSKKYKKLLRKILMEFGGINQLFKKLKESDDGNRLRKKYFNNLIITGAFLLSMFVWIFITIFLTGGRDIDQFNNTESFIFVSFIFVEIITLILEFFFAFRSQKIVFQGVSYLIDSYILDCSSISSNTIENYQFAGYKSQKVIIFTVILSSVLLWTIFSLNNGFLSRIYSGQPKEFSKAGMTITLTKEFNEKDIVSQTATYSSSKYVVVALKEEFSILTENDISSDITLKDYADCIITNNSINSVTQEKDSITYFTYDKQVNGKYMTYLETVFKGSDAFWIVTFACESKDYSSSQIQFINWAKTVRFNPVYQGDQGIGTQANNVQMHMKMMLMI